MHNHKMLQPAELKKTRPVELHNNVISTTTEVWQMLTASCYGELNRVKELAQACRELLTCEYDYTSPLHLAVREGHLEVVQFLVAQGALDPTYRTHPFLEPLTTVADDHGHQEIASILKTSMNDPSLTRAWGDTGKIDYGRDEDQSRFQKFVSAGNCAEVEAMLKEHPELALDPDAFWGEGILSVPAKNGNREMLALLMRYGASVPDTSKWGARYYFKHYDTALFLLESGMNPNHTNWRGFTLLHDMARTGDTQKAQLLLDHGADINVIDHEFSSSPLGYAARWGHREIVSLLLERGADASHSGAPWASPFVWAQKKGHPEIEAALRAASRS